MSKTPPTPVPRAQPPAPVARTAPAPAARAAPAPVARSAPPAPAAAGGGATNSSSSSSTPTTGRAMPTPPPRSAAAAGGGAPPSRAAPATSSSSSSASTASTAHKPHAAPAPVASNHTHSVSSSSSTATATGPRNTTGWLCTVEQLPDGTQLRPSRFIDAAKKGQDDLLQEFHDDPEKTIDVNKIDPIYQTALHWAARGGHYSTVKLLISFGANVNFRDKTGETPLHKAAFGNHDAICTLLLEAGCDRDIPNQHGLIAMDLTEDRDTRFALAPPQYVDEPDTAFEQDDADSD